MCIFLYGSWQRRQLRVRTSKSCRLTGRCFSFPDVAGTPHPRRTVRQCGTGPLSLKYNPDGRRGCPCSPPHSGSSHGDFWTDTLPRTSKRPSRKCQRRSSGRSFPLCTLVWLGSCCRFCSRWLPRRRRLACFWRVRTCTGRQVGRLHAERIAQFQDRT
jgi:hypothetical protein